jgi:hypothetical protein
MTGFWQSYEIADSLQYMDICELEGIIKFSIKVIG